MLAPVAAVRPATKLLKTAEREGIVDVTRHLLIESQGCWAGPQAARFLEDARVLAEAGQDVTVLLLQDGVLSALPGAVPVLARLGELGVDVWVDDFSMAQRALPASKVAPPVHVVSMARSAELLMTSECRTVWH